MDGTKIGATYTEVELESEVVQKVGQIEDQAHYLSLNVECLTTHKNTPIITNMSLYAN